eukprot:3890859-Pyramimonas_sp.AAC.1
MANCFPKFGGYAVLPGGAPSPQRARCRADLGLRDRAIRDGQRKSQRLRTVHRSYWPEGPLDCGE